MDNLEETTEIQTKMQNELVDNDALTMPIATEEAIPIDSIPKKEKTASKKGKSLCRIISYGMVVVAIIILYILHFTQSTNSKHIPVHASRDTQMMILTINTDSIMEHFMLVALLKNDLEKETEKYQKDLQAKSSSFETKYQNYMLNVQNNVLTQTQMQNAERQLLQEKESLEALSAKYTQILADKEMSVNNEIMDSLKNTAKRINDLNYNADYVFAINAGSAILHANTMCDITDEVIKEMNESYKKSTK
jgi:outer membrane protein